MLALDVSEDELMKRLLHRGKSSRRSDDVDETVIRSRIREYENKTKPVADYYRRFNKVVHIKGEGSVHDIFELLCKEIDKRRDTRLYGAIFNNPTLLFIKLFSFNYNRITFY